MITGFKASTTGGNVHLETHIGAHPAGSVPLNGLI